MEEFGPEYNGVKVQKIKEDKDGDSLVKFFEKERQLERNWVYKENDNLKSNGKKKCVDHRG